MSALYLYGFLRCQEEPELPLSGLAEEPLYPVCYQEIAAAISFFPGRFVPLTETNLMAHEGALEVIMEQYSVLPVRFATLLPDEQTAESILSHHWHDLDSNLSEVEGKVEFGLKALWNTPYTSAECRVPQPSTPVQSATPPGQFSTQHSAPCTQPPSPGTSYLVHRLREEQQRECTWDQADQLLLFIDTSLTPFVSQRHLCRLPTDRMPLSAAYLVARNNIPSFKRAFYHLKESTPALKFLLSGPWPPYNFVSVNLQLPRLDSSPWLNSLPDVGLPSLEPLTLRLRSGQALKGALHARH